MPETAVDKDNHPRIRKNHIGFARQLRNVFLPPSEAGLGEHGKKPSLKARSFSFDGAHGLGSICWFQIVDHGRLPGDWLRQEFSDEGIERMFTDPPNNRHAHSIAKAR